MVSGALGRFQEVDCKGIKQGAGTADAYPRDMLPPSAIWTTFVDTPLTARELVKVKRKIEHQTGGGDGLLH